jgi:hypothetical protein
MVHEFWSSVNAMQRQISIFLVTALQIRGCTYDHMLGGTPD